MNDTTTNGLPLDSPEWNRLEHAYGSCESTLKLLKQLKAFAEDCSNDLSIADSDKAETLRTAMLDEFGSNLFHQQSTYDATIAAVPHFVEIAKRLPQKFKRDILLTVAWIQRAGGFVHAESLPNLRAWYNQAIKDCVPLIDEWLVSPAAGDIWPQLDMLKSALGVRGVDQLFLADVVHWFEEFYFTCHKCFEDLYVQWIEEHDQFDVWEAKLVRSSDSQCSVEPNLGKPNEPLADPSLQSDFELMLDLVTRAPARKAEAWVRSFYGRGKCPSCQTTFCVGQLATKLYKTKRENAKRQR